MTARGYVKPPCTQLDYSQGVAVGHIQRYRCERIRIQGSPMS